MRKPPAPENYTPAQITELVRRCIAPYGQIKQRSRADAVCVGVMTAMASLHLAQRLIGRERNENADRFIQIKWLDDEFPHLIAEAVKELDRNSPTFGAKVRDTAFEILNQKFSEARGNSARPRDENHSGM